MINLSLILPSYREPYLNKTINSILENAVTDIEIIPVLDAWLPDEPLPKDKRVNPIYLEKNRGMRGAINMGLEYSKGKFIMKLDSHCAVAPGFDKVLTDDCKENWLMVPRRYSLDENTWGIKKRRPSYDYHRLTFPGSDISYGYSMQVTPWYEKGKERREHLIDEVMIFQGSGMVANREYFMKYVGYLDDREETYGSFSGDQLEIGLKYWLNGGKIMVNKKTWYAHLSKRGHHYKSGVFSRKHKKDRIRISGNEWSTRHWMDDQEPNMKNTFEWYINKFNPPGWDNWKQKCHTT